MEITISNSQEETLRSDKKGRKTRKQRFFIALITIPLKNLLKKNGKQAKKRLQYSKTETFTHTHTQVTRFQVIRHSRDVSEARRHVLPLSISLRITYSPLYFS